MTGGHILLIQSKVEIAGPYKVWIAMATDDSDVRLGGGSTRLHSQSPIAH